MEKKRNKVRQVAEVTCITAAGLGVVAAGLISEGVMLMSRSPVVVESQKAMVELGCEIGKLIVVAGGVSFIENLARVMESHVR